MPIQRQELGVSGFAIDVTPSDTTNIQSPARYLYIGQGGNLNITPEFNGGSVVLTNVPTAFILYASVARVNNTGTTAANIVAFL